MIIKKMLLGLAAVLLVFVVAFFVFLSLDSEFARFTDSTGIYTCVITVPHWERLVPRFPGQGSDASCFFEIFKDRKSMGKIPVAMLQYKDDFYWEQKTPRSVPTGAYVKLQGEWDFVKHTCYFWSEDQKTKIWVEVSHE